VMSHSLTMELKLSLFACHNTHKAPILCKINKFKGKIKPESHSQQDSIIVGLKGIKYLLTNIIQGFSFNVDPSIP